MNDILNLIEETVEQVIVEEPQPNYTSLTINIIQELLTSKNSSPLKPNYGTEFIANLGDIVNEPKIKYYLKEALNELSKKYPVKSIDLLEAYQEKDYLVIKVDILFSDNARVTKHFNVVWKNKQFTSEGIIEEVRS